MPRTLLTFSGVILVLGSVLILDRTPPAWSMTAHGTERKSIATVPLDAGMEAVVTLDHTTGDLTGYVLDRFTGLFFIQYVHNVAKDFPRSQGNFLMAAGTADFRQMFGNERFARGVIYVAEETSGQVVAYGIPWNSQLRASTATPRRGRFIPLDFAITRFRNP